MAAVTRSQDYCVAVFDLTRKPAPSVADPIHNERDGSALKRENGAVRQPRPLRCRKHINGGASQVLRMRPTHYTQRDLHAAIKLPVNAHGRCHGQSPPRRQRFQIDPVCHTFNPSARLSRMTLTVRAGEANKIAVTPQATQTKSRPNTQT
jgi:hypothetical protein